MSSNEIVKQLIDGSGAEAPLSVTNDQGNNDTTSQSGTKGKHEPPKAIVNTRERVTPASARASIVKVLPRAIDDPANYSNPTCVQCGIICGVKERRVCPCKKTYCEYCLGKLVDWMVFFNKPLPVYHCGRQLPSSPCDCEVRCTNSDDDGTYCVICRLPQQWWKNEVPDLVHGA